MINKAYFLVLASIFTVMAATAHSSENPNCTLKMTNDYVSGTFMMHEIAGSVEECKTKCQEYGDKNIKQMADPKHYDPVMKVLSYECLFDAKTVDQVDYTK